MNKLTWFAAFTLAFAAAPLNAQTPEATPAPAAPSAPAAADSREPAAQASQFFQMVMEGRVDAAYDQLLAGTKILEMPQDVANLKAKTKEAIRVFGNITSFEQVEAKAVGTRLTRVTCVSAGTNYPIRWRFYFYKPAETWKLVDIRIDDRLTDLFEEPPRLIQAAPQQVAPQQAAPARKAK